MSNEFDDLLGTDRRLAGNPDFTESRGLLSLTSAVAAVSDVSPNSPSCAEAALPEDASRLLNFTGEAVTDGRSGDGGS